MNNHRSTPSLKKYHTFDMELNSNNITKDEDNIIIKQSRNDDNRNGKNIEISNENILRKKYVNTVKSAEDSVESTTEMTPETGRKIESVEIIDDNGSLENHKTDSNEKSQEVIYENFESNEKNHKNIIKSTEITKMEKEPKLNISTTTRKPKVTANETDEFKNSVLNYINKNGNQYNIEPRQTTAATNEYISQNGRIFSTRLITNSTTIPKVISEAVNNNYTPFNNILTEDVTSHGTEDIIPPTPFNTYLKTTPSTKDNEVLSNSRVNEENELQNLDNIGIILTSRETATQSTPIFTTVRSISIPKKGMLPFADSGPSTKSIDLR